MHSELLQMAADLARRDEPFVLAVVVRRRPASSAQAGDMAVITAAGEFHGWLGGSCTQPTVIREAQHALADGKPRLLALSPDPEAERRPGVAVFPMTCHSGGSVEIYLEPILPAPRLAVFGSSPTARALMELGKAMGYSVTAAATSERSEAPRGPCFAVVATMGDGDEEAIRDALALRPAYLGVVASRKRFAQIRETLLAQGVTAAALDSIRSPAGVAIGAQTPEEIAVSVVAEIVAWRRAAAADATAAGTAAAGAVAADAAAGGTAAAGLAATPAEAGEEAVTGAGVASGARAIDPVCGMTVDVAGARHSAEHAGRTYYFCGAGCRERFLAAPESFAAPRQPGPTRQLRQPRKSEGAA
jgi:xanthine dehydrogenase accessory factor